jgi:hypothetical protein
LHLLFCRSRTDGNPDVFYYLPPAAVQIKKKEGALYSGFFSTVDLASGKGFQKPAAALIPAEEIHL